MTDTNAFRRTAIVAEIHAERDRQDAKWGGPEHDDSHSLFEWWGFMRERMVGRAYSGGRAAERRDLIQIAALALAAIESIDRKTHSEAKP